MIEPSIRQLEGQVSFDCGSKTSLVTMWVLMKLSWCPNPNVGLKWVLTAKTELEESLHDLAMIHHLLALKITRQDDKQPRVRKMTSNPLTSNPAVRGELSK